MGGIYAIGTKVFTEDGSRLFAHQFGDGFVIVSDFHETNLDRCTAIAVALMRHISKAGCLARAAIAEGDFADISGCWPREIREARALNGGERAVQLGSGLLTLLPVMGTALISANKLDSCNPTKGAILTVETANASRISRDFRRTTVAQNSGITVIDWVHATSPILEEIEAKGGIGRDPKETEDAVRQYIASQTPPPLWVEGTNASNNILPAKQAKRGRSHASMLRVAEKPRDSDPS